MGLRDMVATRRSTAEDSPDFNWTRQGNRRRGVVLRNGKRVNVNRGQFIRLNRASRIDPQRTPTLPGDPRPIKK